MLTAGEMWFVVITTTSLSAGALALFAVIIAILDRLERRRRK